jgi:phosphoribosylformylglycinamidine synthase
MAPSPPSTREFLRVEVATRPGFPDAAAARIAAEIGRLRGRATRVQLVRGYSLAFPPGACPEGAAAARLLHAVLADPVLHESSVLSANAPVPPVPSGHRRVDVVRRPGVMDPAAASVLRALAAVGLKGESARTYSSVLIGDVADAAELRRIGERCLANLLVEEVRVDPNEPILPFSALEPAPFRRVEVPLRDASDEALLKVSRDGMLALDLAEMRAIQAHFRAEGREPTDVELETLAQTWSEHCKHKTLTSEVTLTGDGAPRRYGNLLKETIFAATQRLAKPWCLSVFKDNAGVIEFDDEFAVTFKVETHNHPSALEPYGGAGTGIGGVIRDTLGTGLGAKPILSTDVFCVGPLAMEPEELPPGTLPPRRILQGVVAGVRDYGNRMGIPTCNGAVFVHPDYRTNPLVFAGNVGLIPRDRIAKGARRGDKAFVLGGRTGRDGIHGATFSSLSLDSSSSTVASGAVQIGNAIEEKKLLDAVLAARDLDMFTAVTDCGAGGLSSAIGEMGEALGADIELSRVPLKYFGLTAGEIWISEAQERMVVAVKPERAAELVRLCRVHGVEATELGTFTGSGRLRLAFEGQPVADLSMKFLHDGIPKHSRTATVAAVAESDVELPAGLAARPLLLQLLASPDITSKEEIVRQYDHEVLAGSVVKPLVGQGGFGPSDACVTAPRLGSRRGIAVGCGLSPTTGAVDPHAMSLLAVDEAVRNVICVGGRFDRLALLDNFAWPSVDDAATLGSIARCAEGCRDAALAYGTPFISGKDSLHNQTRTKDSVIRIPPTLLVSAIAMIDDVTTAVTMDAKAPEELLLLVGETRRELGGSRLLQELRIPGGRIPRVDLGAAAQLHGAVTKAIATRKVRAAHDLSEGGLAVAAAEMCLAGGLGAALHLGSVPRPAGFDEDLALLFAESAPRYLLAVGWDDVDRVTRELAGVPHAIIGSFTREPVLTIAGLGATPLLQADLPALTKAFRTGLDF